MAFQWHIGILVVICGICRVVVVVESARAQAPATNEQPWASILYTAVVRGKVALPCDISPPSMDDGVALILWYKDEDPSPIFTLDARHGGPVEQAKQISSTQLENRAYFNMINRPAFLQLDPVEERDAGEYRCRVDFHKARTVNTVITLKVIVPPGEPVIKDQDGRLVKGLVGPFNEGEPLKLICEAEGGKPRPSVTWWREYSQLDDTFTFVPEQDLVRNELDLEQLRRQDLMTVLTCQASNNNITVPASSAITLDLNLRPAEISISPSRRPLSADKVTELTCKSSGSRPAATITWWKGSKLLKAIKEKTPKDHGEGAHSISVLSFVPTAEDNGKYLSCRAENQLISGSALEEGWKLEVYYPPQLTLEMGTTLKTGFLKEGMDVFLECNIRANPAVTEIRWYSEGGELHTNGTLGILVSNQSLVLRKVQRSSSGRYYCTAVNVEGEATSNEILLRIRYSPVCKPGQQQVYGVGEHESAQVLCQLEADPPEINFQWNFNNSVKTLDLATFNSQHTQSVATYVLRSEEDYGSILCWGTNDVGKQTTPCVFTLVPAGPPESLSNCTVLNYTEDSITVECMEGYNGGILQHFELELYEVGQYSAQRNVSSSVPYFVLQGLPGGRNFHLVAYAANAKGRSRPAFLSAGTLQSPEKLTGVNGIIIIRPVLGILIGIVVALVVTAVFVMVLMRLKSRGSNKVTQRRDGAVDKYHTPLKKDTDDSMDNEEKGPDIIPAKIISRSHYTDDDRDDPYIAQAVSPTWNSILGTRQGSISRKPEIDVSDVDMYSPDVHHSTLTRSVGNSGVGVGVGVGSSGGGVTVSGQQATYVKAEYQRHPGKLGLDAVEPDEEDGCTTCETPLMDGRRESAV